MNTSMFTRIGLTEDQAKTYQLLLNEDSLTPIGLSKLTSDKRTNAYMSLAKLEEIGWALRDPDCKRLTYLPVNPAQLERLLAAKEQEFEQAKAKFHDSLPELLTAFYTRSKKPGIRFYEGQSGLNKVYQDHLGTKAPVYFVRTPADEQFFGGDLYGYMEKRASLGIKSQGIAPYTPEGLAYSKANDKKLKRQITWCDTNQYQAPVEISIYGTKTAFISFGEEIVASIIDSPQIAQAMRELFIMARAGAQVAGNNRVGVGQNISLEDV